MSIFAAILEKLGMHREHVGTPDIRPFPPKTVPASGGGTAPAAPAAPTPAAKPAAPAAPAAISDVDVVAQLEKRAAANSQKLNWRTSIVDLLKLLDIDSSLQSRKSLATELGAPANVMSDDSAHMNIWLHKEVLKRIAANGGNVPASLLD
jgi:hypothetical protein